MRRKLFPRLSLLSLVLCLATIGWWWRTSSNVDELAYQREDIELLRVSGHSGKVMLTHALYDRSRPRLGSGKISWGSSAFNPQSHSTLAALGSFSFRSQPSPTGGSESALVLPMWMLVGFFGVMPMCWLASKMRSKPKKKGEGK